jgi:rhodanese-related sulfurtransferase
MNCILQEIEKKFVLIDKAVDLINHQNAKIFDIRENSKFDQGYIKNSFNINVLDIKSNKYIINKYINNCIIICSNNEKNSKESMIILKKEGIKKIYILKGGIQSWTNAGFPVIKKKKKNILNK